MTQRRVAAEPDALLADRWNDAPLTRQHGGPLRAMIPRLYFWKSAKWLRRVEITIAPRAGFWNNAAIMTMATRGWRSVTVKPAREISPTLARLPSYSVRSWPAAGNGVPKINFRRDSRALLLSLQTSGMGGKVVLELAVEPEGRDHARKTSRTG